jgi:hypothetical protein
MCGHYQMKLHSIYPNKIACCTLFLNAMRYDQLINYLCEISGSQGGKKKYYSLLGYSTV